MTETARTEFNTLPAGAKILIAQIGRREFDFFDEGVRDGSGIWLKHMASQTANSRKALAAAKALAKAGLLEIGDYDSQDKDKWLWLTEAGAQVAQFAADAEDIARDFDAAPAEAPKPKAAKAQSHHAGRLCICCGQSTRGGAFLPGHDARFVSNLRKGVAAGTTSLKDARRALAAFPLLLAKFEG